MYDRGVSYIFVFIQTLMKKRITFLFLFVFCFTNIFSQSTKIDGIKYYVIDRTAKTCSAGLDSETGKENNCLVIPNTVKIDGIEYKVVQIESYCDFVYKNIYLKELSIPSSITSIGVNDMSELKTINGLGNNITELQYNGFWGCESLITPISLVNVSKLPDRCFSECSSLKEISVPNVTEVGNSCFSICKSLRKIDLPKVESLPENCFCHCSSLVSVNVPNIKIAGDDCFEGCSSLKEIYLPNVIKLGKSCFESCDMLENIQIPNVEELGSKCFNAYKQTSIELPKARILGDECFYASSLKEINLPNAIELGNSCFEYCTSLEEINIPNVTKVGNKCFMNCGYSIGHTKKGLKNISMPSTLEVGDYCFTNCVNLKNVYFSKNLENLGSYIFSGCDEFNVYCPTDVPPTVEKTFDGWNKKWTSYVFVPMESFDTYKNTTEWKDLYLRAYDFPTNIENVKSYNHNEYFEISENGIIKNQTGRYMRIYSIDGKLKYHGSDILITLDKGWYIIYGENIAKKIHII